MGVPKIVAVRVNFGGGGKVAIKEYGSITSDYHISISRDYVIPDDWDDDEVANFEQETIEKIRSQIDPLLDREYDERISQSYQQ